MLYSVVSPLKLRIGYKIISNSMLLRIDSIRFYMLREILSLKLSTVPKSLFLDRWIIERGIWVTRAIVETKPNVWTNHRIQVFRKNQFFVFLGAQKTFLSTKSYLALETSLFGGSSFKNFLICATVFYFLKKLSQKPWPGSKSFRSMTPPPKKKWGF